MLLQQNGLPLAHFPLAQDLRENQTAISHLHICSYSHTPPGAECTADKPTGQCYNISNDTSSLDGMGKRASDWFQDLNYLLQRYLEACGWHMEGRGMHLQVGL